MSSTTTPTLIAIFIQLGLGVSVFYANRRRKSNQCFFLLSLLMGAWLGTLYFISIARSTEVAGFWIRQASTTGAIVLGIFGLLRMTIVNGNWRWRAILSNWWTWSLAIVLISG